MRLPVLRPLLLRPPALRPLLLRPLLLAPFDELRRVLRLPDALALRLLPVLCAPLPEPLLPLLRPLPLLRLLPLLRELAPVDPLDFWLLLRPRVEACWLLLPLDFFDELRLLERLEEPRPLVADIVHLLLFDSHAQTNLAGAGLPWLYPAVQRDITFSGRMFDALQRALLDE